VGAFLFPLSLVGLSLFTTSFFAHIFLLFLGFSFVSQFSSANTWIQTIVKEEFRGRVMSLYTLMFFGLNPFGSLVAGFLAHQYGLLWGIRLGGFLFLLPLGVFLYQTRALWERGGEGIFLRKVATPGSFVERVR
jgi:MFS family permease